MMKLNVTGSVFFRGLIYVLACASLVACRNGDDGLLEGSGNGGDSESRIVSLMLDSKNESLPVGLSKQLNVTAVKSDGETLDVTADSRLTWRSSDDSVIQVDDKGLVHALAAGQATVTVSMTVDSKLLTDSAVVKGIDITGSTLTLTPESFSLYKGASKRVLAFVVLPSGNAFNATPYVHFSSEDESTATVDDNAGDTKGVVTGVEVGTVNIVAVLEQNGISLNGLSSVSVDDSSVTSFRIVSDADYVVLNKSQQFTALAELADGSVDVDITNAPQLSWSVEDVSFAELSEPGLIQGTHVGKTNIVAKGNFLDGVLQENAPIDVVYLYNPPLLTDQTTVIESDEQTYFTDDSGVEVSPDLATKKYALLNLADAKAECGSQGLKLVQDAHHFSEFLNERTSYASTWPVPKAFWTDDVDEADIFGDSFTVAHDDTDGADEYLAKASNSIAFGLVVCERKY